MLFVAVALPISVSVSLSLPPLSLTLSFLSGARELIFNIEAGIVCHSTTTTSTHLASSFSNQQGTNKPCYVRTNYCTTRPLTALRGARRGLLCFFLIRRGNPLNTANNSLTCLLKSDRNIKYQPITLPVSLHNTVARRQAKKEAQSPSLFCCGGSKSWSVPPHAPHGSRAPARVIIPTPPSSSSISNPVSVCCAPGTPTPAVGNNKT